jgi:hypothetical protein
MNSLPEQWTVARPFYCASCQVLVESGWRNHNGYPVHADCGIPLHPSPWLVGWYTKRTGWLGCEDHHPMQYPVA